MLRTLLYSLSALALAGPLCGRSLTAAQLADGPAIVPRQTINLLGDRKLNGFTHFLNSEISLTDDREEVWSIRDDGKLHVSGRGWGYLRTKTRYRDYHLVLEYQWGEQTWGRRADAARDCGLLVHAFGPDGAYGGTWINAIESQLIEGGSGDVLVLASMLPDGNQAPTRLRAEVTQDRDGEPVWKPGGDARLFPPAGKTAARINWQHRDPDWKDVKGYRGAADVENPVGEWNRMEVICRGDSIQVRLNGILVNEGSQARPDEGYVCLQSEGAEVVVRRFELWPLGKFEEPWQPNERSTNTGYSETGESILPRREPWTPERSAAAWRIDGDFELQLVAAEPLVCDPVDVVWDDRGRMYVAEMRDYPLPPESGPRLSRIRLLTDVDNDGRMDQASTWAAGLVDVQGMLPIDGGLLITCGKGVIRLHDTDEDGVADKSEVLLTINPPRHNQLQISSPRWRVDNSVHFNNGLDGKELRIAYQGDRTLPFRGYNLRFDPHSGDLATFPGVGQFGAAVDDFGRIFFCSNRNPAMFAVLPKSVLDGNPFASVPAAHDDIQPPASRVYPHELSHTTSIAHAGTHTSACGLVVYQGDWMPELQGELFVCDPTGQLVTRNRLAPAGATFRAERVGRQKDFIVSADEWCRPVNLRNGPDGALYICDMYRRFIDHARFFPEEFSRSNYMRAGFDQGRIWRLAPRGATPRSIEPLSSEPADLVAELANANSWRRVTAQRLLVERSEQTVVSRLADLLASSSSAVGRLHALWTLQGLQDRIGDALPAARVSDALYDPAPGIVENAIDLAARRPDVDIAPHISSLLRHANPRVRTLAVAHFGSQASSGELARLMATDGADRWLRRAVLSISPETPARVLTELLQRDPPARDSPAAEALRTCFVELASAVTARGNASELAFLAQQISNNPTRRQRAVLLGLARGISRSRFKSLASLVADPPDELHGKLTGVKAALTAAREMAIDRRQPLDARLDAIALASGELFPLADTLISVDQPPEIQAAVCRVLAGYDRKKVADFFFQRWDSLAAIPRREALRLLTSDGATAIRLMQKMRDGEIAKSLMPPMNRWSFSRSADESIRSLALELFGATQPDRAQLIADYGAALTTGDVDRGRTVFNRASCDKCHQTTDDRTPIAPDIRDVRMKPAAALLSDILDPNRAVEERWTTYNVATMDGQVYSGLIALETSAMVELALADGTRKTIARDQIERVSSTGLSMMPEGIEKLVSPAEMSDLIAFLKSPRLSSQLPKGRE